MTSDTAGSSSNASSIRVLVADDHPLLRDTVTEVLGMDAGITVAGQASNGREAVDMARTLRPDVVLMDVNMPGWGGLEAALRLQQEAPAIRVLMFTVSERDEDLFTAIKFGARGYLLKSAAPQEVRDAVRRVAAGEAVFSPAMAVKLLDEFKRLDSGRTVQPMMETPLSPREREVLGLLSIGSSNREIADRLFISENTVRTHLKNILEKLHLKNRGHAAAYAVRLGVTPADPQDKA